MGNAEKIAELQRQIEAASKAIDELKATQKGREETKFTELGDAGGGGRSNRLADQLAIPPDALKAMLAATPPELMAQLRADARRTVVKSFEPTVSPGKGSGWAEPKPLTQVSIKLGDKIAERFAGPPFAKPKPTDVAEG